MQMVPRAFLDLDAQCYARLLEDPCTAPLCHPVYNGADGGVVSRFETDFVVFSSSTDTCGALLWIPGAIGNNAGNAPSIITIESSATGTAVTSVNPPNTYNPGFTFLNASAAGVRVVSACMQVYWPGSEGNRSGYITYGNANGSALIVGSSYSADGVSQIFPNSERMPMDYVEIKLRPQDGDQNWTPPFNNTPVSELYKKGAVGFVIKGIPTSTGVRVRLVAVYEWQPNSGQGIVIPDNARNHSSNTLDQVINFLDATGNWVAKIAHSANTVYRLGRQVQPVASMLARTTNYGMTKIPAMLT